MHTQKSDDNAKDKDNCQHGLGGYIVSECLTECKVCGQVYMDFTKYVHVNYKNYNRKEGSNMNDGKKDMQISGFFLDVDVNDIEFTDAIIHFAESKGWSFFGFTGEFSSGEGEDEVFSNEVTCKDVDALRQFAIGNITVDSLGNVKSKDGK